MTFRPKRTALFLPSLYLSLLLLPIAASAQGLESNGNITFEGMEDPQYGVLDPETMEEVDPGTAANTTGPLRIDYVPELTFATTTIQSQALRSPVHAQLFHGGTGARGTFIQVSDYRGNHNGWQLRVRQEHQFRHATQADATLKGAMISFDKAWTNTKQSSFAAPHVSKEVIQMNNIGETYLLAEAGFGEGTGTWSIVFGASADNTNGVENTLETLVDEDGQAVLDPTFENQALSTNLAVNLTIPASDSLVAGNYATVLTWFLTELP